MNNNFFIWLIEAGEEEYTMTLLGAVGYYVGRLALFAVVAAIGIALGIRFRKMKNSKEATETSEN